MNFYNVFINAHKGFAYLEILLVAVFFISLLVAMFGFSGKISKILKKSTLFTMIFFHVQLLIGLPLLFIFSNFKEALDSGTLMSNAATRFQYVEHPFSMIIIAVLMTIINKYMKKNENLALKIVFMGVLVIALFGYAFPWAKIIK